MQITISGKNIDVGAALSEYVENHLNEGVKKYFELAVSSHVYFSKERHLFAVDILVNDGTGNNMLVKGNATSEDVYAAFDIAMNKIEKQLRRYKRKLKGHHQARLGKTEQELAVISGVSYVLSNNEEPDESDADNDAPLIIAEQVQHIEELTVSDAVMRMDLGELPAYVFINRRDGAVNMVYRRPDGNISWIDSGVKREITQKAA